MTGEGVEALRATIAERGPARQLASPDTELNAV